MSNLAQFGEDLRLHLIRLQACLDHLNALFAANSIADQTEFTRRLNELNAVTKNFPSQAGELYKALHDGLEQQASLPPGTIAHWIDNRQTAQLHAHADIIEQLATIATELAALTALMAERTTMTAILARQEAMSVQIQFDERP
ncbi:MAG: hypothetical protein G4V63_18465 [Candidatus Afipia apatlaquensis]|uniref:Uncharacterized protein n=1 Tax=Candidatus Afipia apatlaquensis TaxID=2712852 RepID=A0A7C9RH32_9BRAD|nr:hypothetical protein [Candidatus Afipia apatlaquensis]